MSANNFTSFIWNADPCFRFKPNLAVLTFCTVSDSNALMTCTKNVVLHLQYCITLLI